MTTLLRALRHPLRWLVHSLAVIALVGGFASGLGLAAALLASWAGLLVGELSVKRVRIAPFLTGLTLCWLFCAGLASLLTGSPLLAGLLGPVVSLDLATILRWGSFSFVAAAGLRSLGARWTSARVLETGILALCWAAAFAAHRDQAYGQPLWLADLVWGWGLETAGVLRLIGAVLAAGLALLVVLEHPGRITRSAWLLVPGIGGLVLLLSSVQLVRPETPPRLSSEEPPRPPPPPEPPSTRPNGGDEGDGDANQGQGGGQSADGEPSENSEEGGQQPQGGQEGGEQPQGGQEGGQQPQNGQEGGQQPQGGQQGGEQPQNGQEGGQQPQNGQEGGQQPQGGQQGGEQPQSGQEGGQQPQGGQGGGQQPREQGGGQSQEGQQDQEGDATPEDGSAEGDPKEGEGGGQSDNNQEPPADAQGEGAGTSNSAPQSPPPPGAIGVCGDDSDAPDDALYFRQEILSEWTGPRLMPSPMDGDWTSTFPSSRTELPEVPGTELRSPVQGIVALLEEHPGPFGLEAPFAYAPRVNPNPGQFVRSYRFYSRALNERSKVLSGRPAGDPSWSPEERAHYLEHPDDPRYGELTAQILEKLPPELRKDPFAQATAMQLWLGQNMTYSTAAREKYVNSKDPAADFLFGDRVGYCVHAATALNYMLRDAGLPSRIGTGYMIEEDKRQGSAVMLTGKNAHAWAELYLEGVGWLIMDVAPAKNMDPESPPQDQGLVERLAEQARKEPQKDSGPQVNVSELLEIAGQIVRWGLLALLMATTVGVYAWKLWRRLRPLWADPASLGRVGYRATIDRLAELGMVRQLGESREAFAKRIQIDGFEELTELHLRSSLAKPTERRIPPGLWNKADNNVNRNLQRRPLWRRILGWLDPSAAFRAR